MPGFYSAYLEFENGVPAILSHNGYGYFLTTEFMPYGTNQQILTTEAKREVRERLRDGAWDDEQAKNRIRMGGDQGLLRLAGLQEEGQVDAVRLRCGHRPRASGETYGSRLTGCTSTAMMAFASRR